MRISDWSSDVCSSDLQFRLGFTKAHGARSRTLMHLPQHEEGDPKDQKERQRLLKQNHPETGLLFGLATIFDIIVIQQIRKARIADRNRADCLERNRAVKVQSATVRVDNGGCRHIKKKDRNREHTDKDKQA